MLLVVGLTQRTANGMPPAQITARASAAARWAFVCVLLVFLGLGLVVLLAAPGPPPGSDAMTRSEGLALLSSLAPLFVLYYWRVVLHPRLLLADTGIDVVRPLGSAHIEWDDVAAATPGYFGLTILTKSGARITARSILGKTNYSVMRRRQTRSDRVAAWVVKLARSSPEVRLSELESTTFYFL